MRRVCGMVALAAALWAAALFAGSAGAQGQNPGGGAEYRGEVG